MTFTLAALVLTNLLYVVVPVVVATLVSGLYVLRHRKPKSVESGIESFSRGLRALAPDRRPRVPRSSRQAPDALTTPAGHVVRPVPLLQPDAGAAVPPARFEPGSPPGTGGRR